MSAHEGARVIGAEVAAVVGVEPSVYRVGGVPVACNIIAFFVDETSPHSNVRMTRRQTITTSTLLSRVEGAPAGGVGVVSGLPAGGPCWFARHGGERGQVSVKINGHEAVAEGDFYHMDGGNIEGIVTYVVPAEQGVYEVAATGERYQLGGQTWLDDGGRAFGPGEQAFQAGVHWMVGFFNAAAVPAWDAATSLAHGAFDAATYLATTTKQDWYEDAAAMAPGVLSAGADVVDAAMHPIDTFWAGWDSGTAWASDTWASQKDAFYADPAFTVGDWMGNAANAYFLVKDGVAAVNAAREARAARQAAALVQAERDAAEALARAQQDAAERLARQRSWEESLARAQRQLDDARRARREAEALAKAQREAEALAKAQREAEALAKAQREADQKLAEATESKTGVTVTREQPPAAAPDATARINQHVADMFGLTDDSILYREIDTQYLGLDGVSPNPRATGYIDDIHSATRGPQEVPASQAGPGLNVSMVPGEFYKAPYTALISFRWGDIKDIPGLRIYPNISARVNGAIYLQFPEHVQLPFTLQRDSLLMQRGIPRHRFKTEYNAGTGPR